METISDISAYIVHSVVAGGVIATAHITALARPLFIDWGDGSGWAEVEETEISHLYTNPGTYKVFLKTNVTSGTSDHAALTNRDAPAQHPASSITGLAEALEASFDSPSFIGTPTINNKPVATEEWVDGKELLPKKSNVDTVRIARDVARLRPAGTGTVKIDLPQLPAAAGYTFSAEILLHDYSNNKCGKILFRSYITTTSEWSSYRTKAYGTGELHFPDIRIGREGGKHCILIGQTASTWCESADYVVVCNVTCQSTPDNLTHGPWEISVTDDESGITNIVNIPIQVSDVDPLFPLPSPTTAAPWWTLGTAAATLLTWIQKLYRNTLWLDENKANRENTLAGQIIRRDVAGLNCGNYAKSDYVVRIVLEHGNYNHTITLTVWTQAISGLSRANFSVGETRLEYSYFIGGDAIDYGRGQRISGTSWPFNKVYFRHISDTETHLLFESPAASWNYEWFIITQTISLGCKVLSMGIVPKPTPMPTVSDNHNVIFTFT